jgi:4-amino-4-deoxy-L-arabinose transferase-like glycosyltransferase
LRKWGGKIAKIRTLPVLILALNALLRLIWLACVSVAPQLDFQRFFNVAEAFSQGTPIAQAAEADYIALFPHILGYPSVLSVWFRVFGASLWASNSFNMLMSLCAGWLIFSLAKKWGGRLAGICAGLLYALNPAYIMQNSLPGSEPLHLALFLGCVWLFLKLCENGAGHPSQALLWALLGLGVAASHAVRPLGPLLLTGFVIYYLIFPRAKAVRKLAFLGCAVCVYLLSGALFYSAAEAVLERPAAKNAGGWNLYVGMNLNSNGAWNQKDFEVLDKMLEEGLPAPEIQSKMSALAEERIASSVKALPALLARKYAALWSSDSAPVYWLSSQQNKNENFLFDIERRSGELRFVCNAYWWLILFFSATGAKRIFRADHGGSPLALILLAGLVLAFLILEANPRYHFPADALFALLGGTAIAVNNEQLTTNS